jgi:hypothetical protein
VKSVFARRARARECNREARISEANHVLGAARSSAYGPAHTTGPRQQLADKTCVSICLRRGDCRYGARRSVMTTYRF